jgi:hypothetical protein
LLGELPVALFASVNRGILVEETRGLEGQHAALNTPEGKLASELVRWLAKPPAESVLGNGSIETTVGVAPLAPQYGQCKLTLPGNRRIVIHAIFLDVLSLLEPRPGEGQPVVDFSSAPPLVASYRTLGSLRSMHVSRDETTAGRLVKEFMQDDKWLGGGCRDPATGEACEAFPTCPFAQNASWLRHDSLRQRFLDAMRAAEIAAGRRFTYRDLLGHVSLALLGQPEEAWLGGTSPCKWSSQQKQHAAEGKKQSAVALQFHRLYVNLFGSGLAESKLFSERAVGVDSVFGAVKARRERSGEATRIQSFERAFQDIDPACDTDPWDGMRGKALDAVESLDVQSPSEQLSQWPGIPAETLCKIEFDLDHLLREEIISELTNGSRPSARRVRALRRWRSTLMLRQVGLALGNLNFGTAIHAWLAEQENALCSGPRMKLGDGLANLIIPLQVNQRAFLAPFRPRTFCLSQLPPDTVLVSVATTDLVVVVRPQGDTLVAEVQLSRARERKAPQTLAGLVIDLAVAREALLHGDGDVRSFTEIGYTAFARIERARASLISRARLRTMPAYFTDPAGQPFRVSANPGGGVPLRAERA